MWGSHPHDLTTCRLPHLRIQSQLSPFQIQPQFNPAIPHQNNGDESSKRYNLASGASRDEETVKHTTDYKEQHGGRKRRETNNHLTPEKALLTIRAQSNLQDMVGCIGFEPIKPEATGLQPATVNHVSLHPG